MYMPCTTPCTIGSMCIAHASGARGAGALLVWWEPKEQYKTTVESKICRDLENVKSEPNT